MHWSFLNRKGPQKTTTECCRQSQWKGEFDKNHWLTPASGSILSQVPLLFLHSCYLHSSFLPIKLSLSLSHPCLVTMNFPTYILFLPKSLDLPYFLPVITLTVVQSTLRLVHFSFAGILIFKQCCRDEVLMSSKEKYQKSCQVFTKYTFVYIFKEFKHLKANKCKYKYLV